MGDCQIRSGEKEEIPSSGLTFNRSYKFSFSGSSNIENVHARDVLTLDEIMHFANPSCARHASDPL